MVSHGQQAGQVMEWSVMKSRTGHGVVSHGQQNRSWRSVMESRTGHGVVSHGQQDRSWSGQSWTAGQVMDWSVMYRRTVHLVGHPENFHPRMFLGHPMDILCCSLIKNERVQN